MITISKRLSYRKIDELKFVLRSKIFSFHVAVFLFLYLLQKVTGTLRLCYLLSINCITAAISINISTLKQMQQNAIILVAFFILVLYPSKSNLQTDSTTTSYCSLVEPNWFLWQEQMERREDGRSRTGTQPFNGSLACIFQYTWDVNVVEVVLPINVLGVEIKHPSLSVILSHCHSQPFQVEIIKASETRSSLEINTDYQTC